MKASRHNLMTCLLAMGLALSGGRLYAQDAPADDPQAGDDTGAAKSGDDDRSDVTLSGEREANLSPADMVAESERLVSGMQTVLKKIVGLQQVARKQKDVIKLNCVNDKLLQVKQLLNIAEGATTNMHEAIAQEDEAGRYHEFGKIVIADQQVRVLAGEAENCIGEELVFLGPTEVEVDEPEHPDDPTGPEPEIEIEDPGYASPFL